jgi:hypothetical protein
MLFDAKRTEGFDRGAKKITRSLILVEGMELIEWKRRG